MEEHRLPIVAAIKIYVQRKSHRAIRLQMWKETSTSALVLHINRVSICAPRSLRERLSHSQWRATAQAQLMHKLRPSERDECQEHFVLWDAGRACDASDESSVKQIGKKITEANCALLFLASSKKENWMSRWNVQCQRWRRDELAGSRVMQPPPLPLIFHSATDGFFELFLLLFLYPLVLFELFPSLTLHHLRRAKLSYVHDGGFARTQTDQRKTERKN